MVKHKNWRGCDGIDWVSYNECADPDLVYGDYVFNCWDIEDALWNEFCEENEIDDSRKGDYEVECWFDDYVQANAEDYLLDCIYDGYFMEGSKSWHDRH